MSQQFQVLRCFNCNTFQVHQVKKSIKWACKMCGDKQSITRNYGTGTGKECRFHVQKLNSLRGELAESVDTQQTDDFENEEPSCNTDNHILENVHSEKSIPSKWCQYIETEPKPDLPEPEQHLYRGAEVVLELPKNKSRKRSNKTFNNEDLGGKRFSPQNPIPTVMQPSTQINKDTFFNETVIENSLTEKGTAPSLLTFVDDDELPSSAKRNALQVRSKHFEAPKVSKNSKWAKYVEEDTGEMEDTVNDESAAEVLESAECSDKGATTDHMKSVRTGAHSVSKQSTVMQPLSTQIKNDEFFKETVIENSLTEEGTAPSLLTFIDDNELLSSAKRNMLQVRSKHFEVPKVSKNSKWAKYVEEDTGEPEDIVNEESDGDLLASAEYSDKGETTDHMKSVRTGVSRQGISFCQCSDEDIDQVLDF